MVGHLRDLDQRGGVLLGRRVRQPLPSLGEHPLAGPGVAHADDQREPEPLPVRRGQRRQLGVVLVGEPGEACARLVADGVLAAVVGYCLVIGVAAAPGPSDLTLKEYLEFAFFFAAPAIGLGTVGAVIATGVRRARTRAT